jgi:hypothetical protein
MLYCANRSAKIRHRAIVLAPQVVGRASHAESVKRIEFDRLIEIPDRLIVVALLDRGIAALRVAGRRRSRQIVLSVIKPGSNLICVSGVVRRREGPSAMSRKLTPRQAIARSFPTWDEVMADRLIAWLDRCGYDIVEKPHGQASLVPSHAEDEASHLAARA